MLRNVLTRILPAAVLGLSTLVAFPLAAEAVPFSTDLVISGNTDFDEGFAAGTTGTQTGSFSVKQGAADTTSTYSGDTVTGSDPLMGTLTDIGDGFGITAMASAEIDEEILLGLDTTIDLQNTSGTDTYKVTFKVTFNNNVNTTGDDAYSFSALTVNDDTPTELFFTDVRSDTVTGNEAGDTNTGFGSTMNIGGMESSSGMYFFDVTLAPGATAQLVGALTIEGGVFADPGTATANFSSFLSVDAVMNLTNPEPPQPVIPEPSTLLLFGTGLGALALYRQRFHKKTT